VETGVPLLERLDQIVKELGFEEYTTSLPGSKLNMFMYTLSLMIGTAGLPHVIVRFFTVPKVKDARISAGWALVFIALLYTVAPAIAAMAKYNLHATLNSAVKNSSTSLFDTEASLLNEERPEWMKRWEKTGLLTWEDKNGDGRIQYYNDKSKNTTAIENFEKAGWKGNELTVNADIIVLANPEIANLPNWVIALIAAGGIAAALSTAAGLLLAISSAVSHDLVKNVFRPDLSEKSELLIGKISMAISILFAGYLGLDPPGFAAGTVALAFGIAASSLFPAIMLGIFSKKMNRISCTFYIFLFYYFFNVGLFICHNLHYWLYINI
jgi:cation/acetate symporter